MTEDKEQMKLELMQALLRNGKTIWDGIEFLTGLVPEDQISHKQTEEIMCSLVEKARGSVANALHEILVKQRIAKAELGV